MKKKKPTKQQVSCLVQNYFPSLNFYEFNIKGLFVCKVLHDVPCKKHIFHAFILMDDSVITM